MTPSQSDMSAAVDYLDGSMSEEQRLEFESRMSGDTDLADAVELLFETDELMRRVGPGARGSDASRTSGRLLRFPTQGSWLGRSLVAAAAAVLVLSGLRFFAGGSDTAEFSVALAPSWRTAKEFADNHPALAELKPPGLQRLRSVPEEPNCTADDFQRRAAEVEGAVELHEREDSSAEITAGHFVVPIEVGSESSIIVLAVPRKNGAAVRLFPEQSDVRAPAEQGRVSAGRHVLPAERIDVTEQSGESQIAYRPGFLVPLNVGGMDVIVGVREAPFEGDTLGKLDAALAEVEDAEASAEVTRLRAALEANGFRVAVRRVLEPNE